MGLLDQQEEHDANTVETATQRGDRRLGYAGLIAGVICALVYLKSRDSATPSPLGLAMLWSAGLFLGLFGVNRHLARFRTFWTISICIVVLHLLIVKLVYWHLLGMTAWMIAAFIAPEFLIMMTPYVWLEKKESGRSEGFDLE